MTRHTLTIDHPDSYAFTVACACGFHACACSFDAAHDAAFDHLGLPTEAPA